MSSVSTTNISGTDNDFGRPSGTGVSLYRYPGTSYLATIMLSLRDKIHSSAEALLKLTLMGCAPCPASHVYDAFFLLPPFSRWHISRTCHAGRAGAYPYQDRLKHIDTEVNVYNIGHS